MKGTYAAISCYTASIFFIENVFNGKQSEFLHILLIIGYLCFFFIIITVLDYLHLFKFFNISLKQASRLKIYVSSVNEYCKKSRESLPNHR